MNEREKKARKALERARVQLLLDFPFFGVLATHLELKRFEAPPQTAGMGVDGTNLYFDPDRIQGLTEKELQGSWVHELLHCALGHPWRREDRDHRRWNYAADYAVNPIVFETRGEGGNSSLELPEGVLHDEKFRDMSAEQIYEELPSRECSKCGSENIERKKYQSTPVDRRRGGKTKVRARFKCGSCGHEWEEEETVTKGASGDFPYPFDESDREPQRVLDDHSKWGEHEGEGSAGKEGKSAEELKEKWKKRTVRAAERAKSQGSLPAGIGRLVEDLLYPKLNWRKLLNRYVTRHRGGRLDWKRPNRRWIQQGIYYPTRREKRLEAAVAVDTSGSISDEELRSFLGEMKGILTNFRSFKVRMFAADADVHTEATVESLRDFEEFQTEIKGCGGTDYRPVFNELENSDVRVLVYLGDMKATFPGQAPPFDVIWVVSKEGEPEKPPFGEVVEMG